jgi:cytochrome c biogenesis protein CcdA
MLAGSMGHRLRPVFIVLGSAVTFTLMGGLFSIIGSVYTKEALRYFFVAMIILFGAIWADRDINNIFMKYSSIVVGRVHSALTSVGLRGPGPGHPLLGAFTLGLSLGVVWIPCVGPILGSVLAYTTYQGNILHGSFLLLSYSAGLSIPVLFIAYTGKRYSNRLKWIEKNSEKLERFAGWVMILTGVAILWGLDKQLQAMLLPYITDIELVLLKYIG